MTLLPAAGFWQGWPPASCLPDGCFCEAIRQGAIAQPSNFWSSFGFVAAAILIWRKAALPLLAAALLLVGAGSAFYHASLTFAGQAADVSGMYAIATVVILYGLRRPVKDAAAWFAGVNLLLLWLQVEWPGARRYIFAVLVLAVVILSVRGRRRGGGRYLAQAILVFSAGCLLWAIDITRVACAPDSWLQGHAVWHLAGAISAWLLARHLTDQFDLTNQIK